jgi:hypothetical protein
MQKGLATCLINTIRSRTSWLVEKSRNPDFKLTQYPKSSRLAAKALVGGAIDAFAMNRADVDDGRRPTARAAWPLHDRRHALANESGGRAAGWGPLVYGVRPATLALSANALLQCDDERGMDRLLRDRGASRQLGRPRAGPSVQTLAKFFLSRFCPAATTGGSSRLAAGSFRHLPRFSPPNPIGFKPP